MELGHVAAVSRIIDSRTVLLRHANWSPINGRRGQIEKDVRAVDVSPENDWSEVRVWYAPIADLGTTRWPVNGFIYNEKPRKNERLTVLASAETATRRAPLMARTEPRGARLAAVSARTSSRVSYPNRAPRRLRRRGARPGRALPPALRERLRPAPRPRAWREATATRSAGSSPRGCADPRGASGPGCRNQSVRMIAEKSSPPLPAAAKAS
jgi:hypothetical protein